MRAAKTFSSLKSESGLLCRQDNRPNSTERGYNSRWQRARRVFLKKNPLCVECQRAGITERATTVDHIVPHKGNQKLFWNRSNWRAMCEACHNRATALYDGGFGREVKAKDVKDV